MIQLDPQQLDQVTGAGGRQQAIQTLVGALGDLSKHEIGDLQKIASAWIADNARGRAEWRRVTDITTFHLRRTPFTAQKPEVRLDVPKGF